MLERSKVALFVRVVVRGESVEGFHFLPDRQLIFQGQGINSGRLHDAARYAHSLAAKVVQCGDFGCVGCHFFPRSVSGGALFPGLKSNGKPLCHGGVLQHFFGGTASFLPYPQKRCGGAKTRRAAPLTTRGAKPHSHGKRLLPGKLRAWPGAVREGASLCPWLLLTSLFFLTTTSRLGFRW